MAFGSLVASPEQLDLMKQVLDDYCLSHNVAAGTPDYELVAGRIVFLFSSGVTSLNELKATLATAPVPLNASKVIRGSERYPLPYDVDEFTQRHGFTPEVAKVVLLANKRSKEMADQGAEIFKRTAQSARANPRRRRMSSG